ncbi:LysR substrate-binding domain-containing protein [Sphingomonas sp. ERG5]|uniref:LysR substrate-binding domain-containing protein n=1 Tax=Sphingomonas sp. ERG5 TaxID=1381597 RepID=UPI00054BE0B0|nr:LysR substrate-binding domain-containing protein [Sphingomonas sp. ERG5]
MNDRSRRLLPPMGALHSFVIAARHESFSRAADEIGLTQSAISRQIATLEDWLQVTLFTRTGRRVALSNEGRAYLDAVAPALAAIRVATSRVIARPDDNALSIATLPGFGMRWLAPRLGGLTREVPELVINVAARVHEFDLEAEGFDAMIHFGAPDWHGMEHDLLFREESIVVLAPALLADARATRPTDLLKLPLLSQAVRRGAWRQWFDAAGLDAAVPGDGPVFEHFLMIAQAAAGGAGAALLPRFMVEPELESGALVAPFDRALEGEGAYYLVYPADRLKRPIFARFRAWIVAEAAAAT